MLILYSFFVDISSGWGGNVKNKSLIFILIFSLFLFTTISFAECNHEFEIVEIDDKGSHNRLCKNCGYEDNPNVHILEKSWSFDDSGEYHFNKCKAKDCEYEYNKGEHINGSHNNGGECSICRGIYQTHELNAEKVQSDDLYHWYTCSYSSCDYVYDKDLHEETKFVNSDLDYHWYRCKVMDCSHKFKKAKHYGGNNNKGYCSFEVCNRLYLARLEIDEYAYREYKVGDKDTLTANIIPEDIEVPEAEYKWSSSMPDVVKIDKEGNIEVLREGIAIVYCTYGKFSARCVISVGELDISIEPNVHDLYPNEIGTSEINVTYKNKNKDININDYVDFKAFIWEKDGLKADIKSKEDNKVSFIATNESVIPVKFYMWLDNRINILEEKLVENFEFDGSEVELVEDNLVNLKKDIKKVIEKIDEDTANKKTITIKESLEKINEKIKDKGDYEEEELLELKALLIKLWGKLLEYRKDIVINILKNEEPVESPGQEEPVKSPGEDKDPEKSPEPEDEKPEKSPGDDEEEPKKSPEDDKPVVEGPIHAPEPGVGGGGAGNVFNRRHFCSFQNFLPIQNDPEAGHMRRCSVPSCEFYKNGLVGSEQPHEYRYNEEENIDQCTSCQYKKGTLATEPEIKHSRDFGIDVLQSQYILAKDKTTEVKVIITGVEKDVEIKYGPINGTLKSTGGRDEGNAVTLRWDVKDEYLKKALDIDFEKREDERILKIKMKDGYEQSSRSEIDLWLENQHGEKRPENIEVIKQAPDATHLITRWAINIPTLNVGETKEIKLIAINENGFGMSHEEIIEYYKSKNLPKYEDIKIEWASTGGIKVTPIDTTPDSEGYVRAQITATAEGEGIVIAKTTGKYENGDIIINAEMKDEYKIKIYKAKETETTEIEDSPSAPPAVETENNGSSLPIAAGVMGGMTIIMVAIVVNKMTK